MNIHAKAIETEDGYDAILKTFEDSTDIVKNYFNSMDPDGEFDFPNDFPDIMEDYKMPELGIYLHPVVLGRGKPYFAGPRPRLRLLTYDRMDEDVIRLNYVPA